MAKKKTKAELLQELKDTKELLYGAIKVIYELARDKKLFEEEILNPLDFEFMTIRTKNGEETIRIDRRQKERRQEDRRKSRA